MVAHVASAEDFVREDYSRVQMRGSSIVVGVGVRFEVGGVHIDVDACGDLRTDSDSAKASHIANDFWELYASVSRRSGRSRRGVAPSSSADRLAPRGLASSTRASPLRRTAMELPP